MYTERLSDKSTHVHATRPKGSVGRSRELLHVLNINDMTNGNLPVFFPFRHSSNKVRLAMLNFQKNFPNSKSCDSESKATDKGLLRGKTNSSRAKYKLLHFFLANTQNSSEYPDHLSVLSRAL